MKKRLCILIFALIMLATSCSAQIKHPEWPDSWVRVGDHIGVEAPEGFELVEENDVLSISGIYYYAWAKGEGRAVTNSEGKEAVAYPVQVLLLYMETDKPESAIADWLGIEKENYEAAEGPQIEGFDTLTMTSKEADGAYSGGSAAFGRAPGGAISVEVMTDGGADSDEILKKFISGIHFAESAEG
ncbi:MAG: hypothetical protein IJP43_03555 [Oscillospiraceae bacterium]|nr:hypothetical protein [Oscillospiraceae bacterium]